MLELYPPVCGWADVDFARLATRLELVGERHVVPEEAVTRHLDPDDPREHATRVNPDPHLQQEHDAVDRHQAQHLIRFQEILSTRDLCLLKHVTLRMPQGLQPCWLDPAQVFPLCSGFGG